MGVSSVERFVLSLISLTECLIIEALLKKYLYFRF